MPEWGCSRFRWPNVSEKYMGLRCIPARQPILRQTRKPAACLQSKLSANRYLIFYGPSPDLVVLDPPRSGVGYPSLKALVRLQPRRVFYVSCHPPTLARDLAFLLQQGYVMTSLEMFDFFPQTYHIETFAQLRRAHL